VRWARAEPLRWVREHRTLVALGTLWLLFVANFTVFAVDLDSGYSFTLVQKFFGERHDASTYQFGLAFVEVPMYAFSKLFVAAGLTSVGGLPIGPGVICIFMALLVLVTCLLLVPLLRELRLPGPAFPLLIGLFGTPLFWYGTFSPTQTHVLDTLLFTVLLVLLFRYFRTETPPAWLPVAMGVIVVYSATVRYFTGAEAVGLVGGLLVLRRRRDAGLVVLPMALAGLVLVLLSAAGVHGLLEGPASARISHQESARLVSHLYPLTPVRMLFSNRRGLFVWTPAMLLGAIGYVRLLRTRPRERPFLAIGAAMAVSLVAIYALVQSWDGGFGFSQRYLTSLFPLAVLGIASLLEWRPVVARVVGIVAACWALMLGAFVALGFGFDEHTSVATDFPRGILDGKYSAGIIAQNLYDNSHVKVFFPRWHHH